VSEIPCRFHQVRRGHGTLQRPDYYEKRKESGTSPLIEKSGWIQEQLLRPWDGYR